MKRTILFISAALIVVMSVQAGELYRWVDAHGKVHYGDRPALDAQQIEEKKFRDIVATDESLPYETRRARERFPVALYVGEGCGNACDEARAYLNKRGIPFSEQKLVTKEEIDAFKAKFGSDQVPALTVGKNFLIGYSAASWASELDVAGYPATAPYRAPKPAPIPATVTDAVPVVP